MSNEFSDLTIKHTKNLTKKDKKDNGIYITPHSIIKRMCKSVKKYEEKYDINIKSILEPSCGTCEFVNYIDKIRDNVSIKCIEINETIYEDIRKIKYENDVVIVNEDFIKYEDEDKYDLIIGNPPYVVVDKKDIDETYRKYIIGRPNLFCMFILKCINMLSDNGILAFVVPSSLLNSSYYAEIRKFIVKQTQILELIDLTDVGKFMETQQKTVGIILMKINKPKINDKYVAKINDNYIFSTRAKELNDILENSSTLDKLNFSVKTGSVVWNQQKEKMSSDENDTFLIYNTNITKDHTIEPVTFKNSQKEQYIDMKGINDVAIVVNRGNGNSKYKFNYAIVDTESNYLVENHLNVITYNGDMSRQKKIKLFKKIIKSFEDERTGRFVELYLENGGLSKTELESVFPIFIDN